MEKIGLVGGISWVSTMEYYRLINEGINLKLGGLNFAECVIHSLNFGDIQATGWTNSYDLLLGACESLKISGVSGIALCANTAHLFADQLQASVNLPFIHIGTETAKEIRKSGIKKVGLLGTKFTMEMSFYKQKLEEHGLEVVTPAAQATRDYIQHTLQQEMGIGIFSPETKAKYLSIMNDLVIGGAECIILGCTEIPMLIGQEDFAVAVFDTTKIHCKAIVEHIVT